MPKVERYECDRCHTLISLGWDVASDVKAIGPVGMNRNQVIPTGTYCEPCLARLSDTNLRASDEREADDDRWER